MGRGWVPGGPYDVLSRGRGVVGPLAVLLVLEHSLEQMCPSSKSSTVTESYRRLSTTYHGHGHRVSCRSFRGRSFHGRGSVIDRRGLGVGRARSRRRVAKDEGG